MKTHFVEVKRGGSLPSHQNVNDADEFADFAVPLDVHFPDSFQSLLADSKVR